MEILEHVKRNFQARMIQWLQLVEISWFLMVWTSSWWKLQVPVVSVSKLPVNFSRR